MGDRIALFGATGFIGSAFLDQALVADKSVRALARDPSRLVLAPRLEVIAGDVADAGAIARVIDGCDVVVSLLGPRRGEGAPPEFLAQSMTRIIAAMHELGISRLVAISGAGITVPGEHKPFPHNALSRLVAIVARDAYLSKKAEFDIIQRSGLEWTAVRPTRVVPGAPSGRTRVSTKAGDVGFTVNRGDLAQFLVEQVGQRNFVREAPYVSS